MTRMIGVVVLATTIVGADLGAVSVAVLALTIVGADFSRPVIAQDPPPAARAAAPVDLTGYWVSIVSEDWRWRMMTPPKGDYASVPISEEGRKVADSWDLARDEASGNACKPFGVGNIMRMPGRLHISWHDDRTLKLEFDAGTQTRFLYFDGRKPTGDRTWQGHSVAAWEVAGQQVDLDRLGAPVPVARGRGRATTPPQGGSLKVMTTNVRAGYVRKNGVPYSEQASITEYFDRLTYPNGDVVLIVRTVVDDPRYLQAPFITSTNFKLERDGSKWKPTPCRIDPPAVDAVRQP